MVRRPSNPEGVAGRLPPLHFLPMRYKKTDRPKSYSLEKVEAFVSLAVATSMTHAARQFGVSFGTVRNHLLKYGHTPRRQGNYTKEETMKLCLKNG